VVALIRTLWFRALCVFLVTIVAVPLIHAVGGTADAVTLLAVQATAAAVFLVDVSRGLLKR
jgi:hypothetical protein